MRSDRWCGVVLLGLVSNPALTCSVESKDLDTQAAEAEDILVGTVRSHTSLVLDDGYPITEYEVIRDGSPIGDSLDSGVTLRLPGGFVKESWQNEGYPLLGEGTRLLVFGRYGRDGVFLLLGGPQSLFYSLDYGALSLAMSGLGDPIVEPKCVGSILVARPLSETPVGDDGKHAPTDRIFVEQPYDYGEDWDSFIDSVSECLVYGGDK
jgi:hypothetical protein